MSWDDSFMPDPEEVESKRQDTYEESVAKYILRQTGQLHLEPQIRDYYYRRDDRYRLGLEGFGAIADFPLTLVTQKMKRITDQTLVDLHLRPTKTPVFEAFTMAAQENPEAFEAGTLGLVFAWPGWAYHMVFHVWDSLILRDGCRLVWYPGRKHRPHILETLDQLLDATGLKKKKKPGADEF